ncbi:helix-turn-helix domain-containing protein, partial [Psychrobacter sp. 1U2]
MIKNLPKPTPLLVRTNNALVQSKETEDRQFVTALGRGLSILAAFEQQEQLSHQQLCQMTALPKATITRLIYTLTTLGFLRITAYGQ